jgi:hypothetical protein
MYNRRRYLYAVIAALISLSVLWALWQTLIGYLVLSSLFDDTIALQPIYLCVSVAGGLLGCVLGKLSGGSWTKGARAGAWLLPCLLLALRLIMIVCFVLSPDSYSFMQ